MKTFITTSILALTLIPFSVNAEDAPLKVSFIEACDSSPHMDDSSNCNCIYNEVIHQFGNDDAKELIPFISGSQSMEIEIENSLSFISGKCEG